MMIDFAMLWETFSDILDYSVASTVSTNNIKRERSNIQLTLDLVVNLLLVSVLWSTA